MTDTTPTPADRPADQLRAAAEKLRAAAMGSPMNSSPWRYAKGLPSDSVRTEVGWEVVYGDAPGDLRYIALMHPGVGLALAAWLGAAAERLGDTEASVAALLDPSALAVARQLLGTTEGEHTAADLEPQDHPGADLFVALRKAGLDVDEAHRRIHAYAAMVLRQEKAIAAPPAPADRAAGLTEAADFVRALLVSRPGITTAGVEAELRTTAAEAADDAAAGVQPPTEGEADTLAPWLDPRRLLGIDQPADGTRCTCGGRFPTLHLHADTHEPAAPAAPEEQR